MLRSSAVWCWSSRSTRASKTHRRRARCWFEAESSTEAEIELFSRASTADIDRAQERGELIRSRAVPTSGKALESDRRTDRFFVSYAHDEDKLCDVLIRLLQEQFGPSQRYQYETWGDWKIEVGARWHDQIQAAIDRCDFGLLLVSPAFLSSKYIDEHELPHFVNGSKPMIPVCVAKLNFDRHALKGLEENQIFFGSHARGPTRGPFADCNAGQRRQFAEELFAKIEERLDSSLGEARPSSGRVIAKDPHRSARRHKTEDFLARLAGDPVQGFVRTRGA